MRRRSDGMRSVRTRGAHWLAGLALAAGVGGLAGCREYLDRRDTLTLASGDAPAHNAAVHTIDPWPPHASRPRMRYDGSRLRVPIETYRRSDRVAPEKPVASPLLSAPPKPGEAETAAADERGNN